MRFNEINFRLISNPHNAPGCIILRALRTPSLRREFELQKGEQLEMLFQVDYDQCAVAVNLGFRLQSVQVHNARYYGCPCHHQGTDGTIACPQCGLPASSFITAARQWLDNHDGKVFQNTMEYEFYEVTRLV